jgi:hypothetical protein
VTLLFVLIVLVGLGLVGFLVYAGGALLSRPKQQTPMPKVSYLALPTLPSLPPPPLGRIARGTTPQPLANDSSSPVFVAAEPTPPIPGVISNRDDVTERTIQPDDRFSIRKSTR